MAFKCTNERCGGIGMGALCDGCKAKLVRDALKNLIEKHDEQPSVLTADDWQRARRALKGEE